MYSIFDPLLYPLLASVCLPAVFCILLVQFLGFGDMLWLFIALGLLSWCCIFGYLDMRGVRLALSILVVLVGNVLYGGKCVVLLSVADI